MLAFHDVLVTGPVAINVILTGLQLCIPYVQGRCRRGDTCNMLSSPGALGSFPTNMFKQTRDGRRW